MVKPVEPNVQTTTSAVGKSELKSKAVKVSSFSTKVINKLGEMLLTKLSLQNHSVTKGRVD